MSLLATIEAMEAAGVPADQIIATVKAMEEARLASQRARTAKCRKNNDTGNGCNVTRVTDVTGEQKEKAPQTPKKEKPSPKKNPPKGGQKERGSHQTGEKRAHRLPADWTPPESLLEIATDLGLSRVQAIDQAERMRDWSVSAPGGAKKDWRAAFRNWVKRAIDRGEIRNDAGSQQTRAEQSRSAFAAALRAKGYSPESDGSEPGPCGPSPQLRLVASGGNGQPGPRAGSFGD